MNKSVIVLSAVFMTFILCSCSIDKATDNYAEPEQNEVSTTISAAEKSSNEITVKINDEYFTAQLYDNETADYFYEMLPLTINMNELHGNEKYYNFSSSLPENSSAVGEINNGDIMFYGDNCLVLFYDSFSTNYSYTKIGYIENSANFADTVGNKSITITFEK